MDRMQQSDVYRPGESCQKLRQEEGLYGLVDPKKKKKKKVHIGTYLVK